jgi:hypothetical protein
MAVMKKLEPGKPLGKELAVDPKGLQKAIEDLRRGEM